MELKRCEWVGNDPQMIRYHDEEWGQPVHDDRKLFEYMVLDAFQSGLSWSIILHKRGGFDRAFAHFEPAQVAQFNDQDIERLLHDPQIVRNRLKIIATISNAQRVAEVKAEYGSLGEYLWQFVEGRTIQHHYTEPTQIGATSPESDTMSAALKKRGFKFFGSTVCYAFMQGAGMINDHVVSCPQYAALAKGVQ